MPPLPPAQRSDCVFRVAVQPATWVNALSTMTNASGKEGFIASAKEKSIYPSEVPCFQVPFKCSLRSWFRFALRC